MRGEFRGHTFVVLMDEPKAGQGMELLQSRLDPESPVPVGCVKPPIPGLGFITAQGEVSEMLDIWWSHNVPADSLPVLLMFHEPGLERWVGGLDAEVLVGVAREDELPLYAGVPEVRALVTQDGQELARQAIADHAGYFGDGRARTPGAVAPAPGGTPFRPRAPQPQPSATRDRLAPPEPISEAQPEPSPPVAPARPGGWTLGLRHIFSRFRPGSWLPEELTRLALSHQTGKIVGVTSRAGGVGKTAVAAALGIIYGEAVQESGWCAAVVDQNIGNPDQWGRLSLTPQVRTVFQIMADIEAGREWTVPAWNRTPALAVYPERRDLGDGYAPGQVERFAGQLRQLHMISVVDLPNRIPAFTSAEASVCAGWVAVADLLLLPTTDDPTRLQGVLDYLDAPLVRGDPHAGYRPARVIVPYIRSTLREVREDPGVRALLEQIRRRVVAVVEVPKNERATLAIVRGQPITEVDAGLRTAYVELALTVARALR